MNKKLYIPTTTLNFNNILSSESVSPKAFYSQRGYGYSRWISVPENPFENSIVLYESYCSFDRPKSDYEDHPLLIEISMEKSELESLKKASGGIYLCDHTIYLDPWNTKFIFFTEEDRKITLSMSESSLETKLIRLYEKKMIVEKLEQKYSAIQFKDIDTINTQAIRNDYQFNKMKGLFYGYYIGALFGTTRDALIKMNVLREIKNTFAAILSSFDQEATTIQQSNLNRLFDFLLKDTPLFKEFLNRTKNEILTKDLIDIIKSEYGYVKGMESLNSLLSGLKAESIHNRKNASIDWIESQISAQKQSMRKENIPVSTIDGEIIIQDYHVSVISDNLFGNKKDKELYLLWINDVLSSPQYNGKVSSFRDDLSDTITIKAKEFYGKDWDISSAKIVLNSLRRHVRGENFVYSWDNSLFSSISAIVTNGEDWNKLLRYMQSHELNDYRLAFSMYGCLNGFANLTREFTDYFFNQDSKYVAEVYKEYYGQFFGKDLNVKEIDYISDRETELNKEMPTKNKNIGYLKSESCPSTISVMLDSPRSDDMPIPNELKCIFDSEEFKSFDHDVQVWLKENSLDVYAEYKIFNNDCKKSFEKFKYPNKQRWGSTKWIGIIKKIPIASKNNHETAESEIPFEEQQRSEFFYLDKNVFDLLLPLLPNDKEVQKRFRDDLEWFQNNYQDMYFDKKKGETEGQYRNKKKDNKSVIDHFNRILKGKLSNSKAPWLKDIYSKVNFDAIIYKLINTYK